MASMRLAPGLEMLGDLGDKEARNVSAILLSDPRDGEGRLKS